MPNIIEQQGLLKGLTDQRLALLMQQPNANIPPFLVAAEAQRRQAIRAQFGGGAQKNESVVDSLARQLARAPQNVNANPPAPPAPPPQQMGIAGIQPQGMADGGPVRRFAADGYVDPNVSYYQDPLAIPYVPQSNVNPFGVVGGVVTKALQALPHSPVPKWRDPNAPGTPSKPSTYTPEENIKEIGLQAQRLVKPNVTETPPEKPEAPRVTTAGTEDTSTENKYKSQREEFRKRYEDLLSGSEPSSWERAQKFFDASQAFFQPNATTGEMIADALGAFGTGMAQEKAAAREADRALQEGLLNLDIEYAKEDRAAEVAAANRALDRAEKLQDVQSQRDWDLQKERTLSAEGAQREFGGAIADIDAKLNATGPYINLILSDAERAALIKQREYFRNMMSTIVSRSGYGISPTREQIEEAIRTGK